MLRGGILALPRHSPPPKYDICACLYSLQVNYIKLKLKAFSDRAQINFYMTRLFLFGKKPLLGLYRVNFNWPFCVCFMALLMGDWILLVFQRVAGYDLVCTIYIKGMSRDYMCVIKGMCRQTTFT